MARKSRKRRPSHPCDSLANHEDVPAPFPRDLYSCLTDEAGVSTGGLAMRIERYDAASKVVLRMAVASAIIATQAALLGAKLIDLLGVLSGVCVM